MTARALLAFGLVALAGAPAFAQDITLDPATPPAIEKAPPPPPPNQVIIRGPGQASDADEGAPASEGVYYEDGSTVAPDSDTGLDDGQGYTGVVPEVHVVKTGDTLWDICAYYYANPWEWPKLWAKNPNITNPHWIYPGNVVRLAQGGNNTVAALAPASGDGEGTAVPLAARRPGRKLIELRQTSFVDDEQMKFAGRIIGSAEEKVMLTTGDVVYLEYPEGKPPQLNQRYAVYTDPKLIKHPETKQVVGAYVSLRGEVRIVEVKKGRKARAVITYVVDVIERGMRVGPGKTQFKDVAPTAPGRDLEGVVIGMLGTDQILGDRQVVFLDRGSDDGVRPGNTMRVLRRGDAYRKVQSAESNAGMDDRKYPDIQLGEVIVLDVAKKSAIGYVSIATQEIEIGDHVLMRQAR
jgi:hypothetical protein